MTTPIYVEKKLRDIKRDQQMSFQKMTDQNPILNQTSSTKPPYPHLLVPSMNLSQNNYDVNGKVIIYQKDLLSSSGVFQNKSKQQLQTTSKFQSFNKKNKFLHVKNAGKDQTFSGIQTRQMKCVLKPPLNNEYARVKSAHLMGKDKSKRRNISLHSSATTMNPGSSDPVYRFIQNNKVDRTIQVNNSSQLQHQQHYRRKSTFLLGTQVAQDSYVRPNSYHSQNYSKKRKQSATQQQNKNLPLHLIPTSGQVSQSSSNRTGRQHNNFYSFDENQVRTFEDGDRKQSNVPLSSKNVNVKEYLAQQKKAKHQKNNSTLDFDYQMMTTMQISKNSGSESPERLQSSPNNSERDARSPMDRNPQKFYNGRSSYEQKGLQKIQSINPQEYNRKLSQASHYDRRHFVASQQSCSSSNKINQQNSRVLSAAALDSQDLPVSLKQDHYYKKRQMLHTQQVRSRQPSNSRGMNRTFSNESKTMKIHQRRQIQTVLDSSIENKTNFKIFTSPHGNQSIQGYVDVSVLSNNERTHLLEQPKESFYNHFERPVNKKLLEKADNEWINGESGKLFKITPQVTGIDLKDKYFAQIQKVEDNMRLQIMLRHQQQSQQREQTIQEQVKRLSDIERQDLAERFEEIHRKFKQMNGVLSTYHNVKQDQTKSIPASMVQTPEGNVTPLMKIYSPDASKNHQFLNEKVSHILNEQSMVEQKQVIEACMQPKSKIQGEQNILNFSFELKNQTPGGEPKGVVVNMIGGRVKPKTAGNNSRTLSQIDRSEYNSDIPKYKLDNIVKDNVFNNTFIPDISSANPNLSFIEGIQSHQAYLVEQLSQFGLLSPKMKQEINDLDSQIMQLKDKCILEPSIKYITMDKSKMKSVYLQDQDKKVRTFEKTKLKADFSQVITKPQVPVNKEVDIKNSLQKYVLMERMSSGQMSSVYQSKSQDRMQGFPKKNLKVQVKEVKASGNNPHNIINLVQKGGGDVNSNTNIETIMGQSSTANLKAVTEQKKLEKSFDKNNVTEITQLLKSNQSKGSNMMVSSPQYTLQNIVSPTVVKNQEQTLQIDSAGNIDEETNEDATNRNVGRSEDQNTKRLNQDNNIVPFDCSDEISPYVEKTRLVEKNGFQSELTNNIDFNINLSDRNNSSMKGIDSLNLLKDKEFNLKLINQPLVKYQTNPKGDFGGDYIVSRPMSQNSSNQSIGIKIAQKLLSQPRAKPLIVKGTMRQKQMESICQQRFKFLGFNQKATDYKSGGHSNQSMFIQPQKAPINNKNYRFLEDSQMLCSELSINQMQSEIIDYNSYEHENRLIKEGQARRIYRELNQRSIDEDLNNTLHRRPIYKNTGYGNNIRVESIQGQKSGVSSRDSSKRDNFLTNPGFISTQGDQNYGSSAFNNRRPIEFKNTLLMDNDDVNKEDSRDQELLDITHDSRKLANN